MCSITASTNKRDKLAGGKETCVFFSMKVFWIFNGTWEIFYCTSFVGKIYKLKKYIRKANNVYCINHGTLTKIMHTLDQIKLRKLVSI